MVADLIDQLNEFYEDIRGKVDLTESQKAEVTGAGAEAYVKILKKNTPKSDIDYSQKSVDVGRSGTKNSHLVDDIQYKKGVSDGLHTGDTDVSFGEKNDFLVHILNDGKKKMSLKEQANVHFLERSQSEARNDIAEAMRKKLDEVMENDQH